VANTVDPFGGSWHIERLTDGIAMLILAGISVTTYAADKVAWIAVPAALIAFGYAALAIQPLGQALIAIAGRLPGLRKVAPKLSEMYGAMRICAAPAPLLITLLALGGLGGGLTWYRLGQAPRPPAPGPRRHSCARLRRALHPQMELLSKLLRSRFRPAQHLRSPHAPHPRQQPQPLSPCLFFFALFL
jgi:hypothetical protein